MVRHAARRTRPTLSIEHWGPPPGDLFVDRSHDPDGEIVIAAMQSGNVVLMVQPPRGFGENPVAIYHDPDLPPSHHYLAAYRWLDDTAASARDAVVHLGKHGNLEWLPGKTLGMSASCGADAALGDLPLIYPFLVNDPGEGTQAKRRAHAVAGRPPDPADGPRRDLRRHRPTGTTPRRARQHRGAGSGQAARHPPADLDVDARREMDHDLGPGRSARRRLVRRHAAARRRLAVRDQGRPDPRRPAHPRPGADRARPNSTWCSRSCGPASCSAARQSVPGLRQALGLAEDGSDERVAVDEAEARARALVAALQAAGWDPGRSPRRSPTTPMSPRC